MALQKFTTTLDADVIKRLKVLAVERESTVSEVLEGILRDAFGMGPTKPRLLGGAAAKALREEKTSS